MAERCLKHEILSTVSKVFDAAVENHAAEMEMTIKVKRNIATYEVYFEGICIALKNGDLSN